MNICDWDQVPDASIQAGSVVGLHNVPAIDVAGTHSTVVGTLGKRFNRAGYLDRLWCQEEPVKQNPQFRSRRDLRTQLWWPWRSPGDRGNHSWAIRRGDHPGQEGCTPARDLEEHFLSNMRKSHHRCCHFEGLKQLTKPGVVVLGLLHNLCTLFPLVSLCLLLVVLVCLAHHLRLNLLLCL